MHNYSRRDFLRIGGALAAVLGLGQVHAPALARGLEAIFERRSKVLWLQAMSCSGCSVSFLNAEHPGPLEVLTRMISLVFHPTLSAAQGADFARIIDTLMREGRFYLVLEGALPLEMPEACVVGGRHLTAILPDLMRKADAIVAAGTCAAFGGIPAAEGASTGAVSVRTFMEDKGLPTAGRLVNCPGCPTHPESLLGTLAYVIGAGYPDVEPLLLTPNAFFQRSVHDNCPRFHDWQKHHFAEKFGDDGCLFKLGCLGPLTRTECPRRQWNGGVNWCIRAGAPCIGCTGEAFARKRDFAFYRKGELTEVGSVDTERKGH